MYIDDIIIFSPTPEQHLKDLEKVFKLLADVDFQINLKKSEFFCDEVMFLGMVVKDGKVTVNKEKIEKIVKVRPPTTLR